MSERRFAALDTSFLLALGIGCEDCEATIDWLNKINVYPMVTSCVIQELQDMADLAPADVQQVARQVLACIPVWGFIVAQLDATENGIAHITAGKLIDKVIDSEFINDGLIVSEAAFQRSALLITKRQCLLQASDDALSLAIVECDLSDLFIVSPDVIVTYLAKQHSKGGKAA